jgi:hypothetical protein
MLSLKGMVYGLGGDDYLNGDGLTDSSRGYEYSYPSVHGNDTLDSVKGDN